MNEEKKREVEERFYRYLYNNQNYPRSYILKFLYAEIERAEKEGLQKALTKVKEIYLKQANQGMGYNIEQEKISSICGDVFKQALSELEGEGVK